MFSITINGNTLEELYTNVEALLAAQNLTDQRTRPACSPEFVPAQEATSENPTMGAISHTYPAVTSEFPTMPQTVPSAPAASTAANFPATANPTTPAAPVVPTTAPAYTLDQLARAGAALAQSGKMNDALAALAKYGVQTVNQLSPDQYGAFATELRALGAQI